MKVRASVEKTQGESDTVGVIAKGLLRVGVLMLVMAVSLFISSGRLDWVMAWVYVGVIVLGSTTTALLMDPELIMERSQLGEGIKNWDKVFVRLMAGVGPLAALIVAGLDMRFGWSSQIPLMLQMAALTIGLLGYGLGSWAMTVNRFFSTFVRIQKDRGHTVVTTGPYQYIRHPGYTGGIIFNLATPLILSSLWAFIPAGFTVCVTVIRTALEDRTLQKELGGYEEYTRRVRYRLLPGVW